MVSPKKMLTEMNLRSLNPDCSNEDANVFIQIPCEIPPNEMNERQVKGLLVGCFNVFIALFFVVYVDYLKSIFKNSYIEWDVKTITAGDYSVEVEIPKKMWTNFLE